MDIETAENRLTLAKKVFKDFDGKLHGGLSLSTVAGYTIVDDKQNRWISFTDDYDSAVAEVISDILDGCYDFSDETEEITYTKLCNNSIIIFCNFSGEDESVLEGLECSDSELREIRELLCIEY